MTRHLEILTAHPGLTIQDLGRPGLLAKGVSRGGAVDATTLAEGGALLGQPVDWAIEMAGAGGRFRLSGGGGTVALTGAPMRAEIDGRSVAWAASHALPGGAVLSVGPALAGAYGYLTLDAPLRTPPILGARSAHLAAGIGAPLASGDALPLGPASGASPGLTFRNLDDRFSGGLLRLLPHAQSHLFGDETLARFTSEIFQRDPRASRRGFRLVPPGEGYGTTDGLSIPSDAITPGDVQVAGDGTPMILLAECQTTGGYPRIGTVISADLPRAAQAAPDAELSFRFVTLDEALSARAAHRAHLADLPRRIAPLLRDPSEMADLLSYRLIDGVTVGDDLA